MMDSHKLPKNTSNLQLLVSAWSRAHNQAKMEQAITEAAPSAPNGSLYLYEADLCYRQANWSCVARSTQAAIQKGGLAQLGQAYLLEGTALIKMRRYIQAVPIFHRALQYPDAAKQAQQWIKYLNYKASLEAARYGKHPPASSQTKPQPQKSQVPA
jgi:tetratricopeptide (TPR) repeat protein